MKPDCTISWHEDARYGHSKRIHDQTITGVKSSGHPERYHTKPCTIWGAWENIKIHTLIVLDSTTMSKSYQVLHDFEVITICTGTQLPVALPSD
jgi:hypothetical protein